MNGKSLHYRGIFITLLIIANCFSYINGQGKNTDKEKILRLHEKDLRASISGYVDSLIFLWDKNGIMLPSKEEPVSGIVAISKYLREAHNKRSNIDLLEYKHDFRELNIVDNMAFEWGFYKNKVRIKKSGNIISVKGKLFRVLKKNETGNWKVYRAIWTTDEINKE